MERVVIDEVESSDYGRGVDHRLLSEPLGTTDVSINQHRLEPGERLSGSIHTHLDQEEVFIVLEGECTFDCPSQSVSLAAGEAIRFAPGEYQSGYNSGDSRAVVLGLGAPKDSEAIRIHADCQECGHSGLCPTVIDGEERLECPDCGWNRP